MAETNDTPGNQPSPEQEVLAFLQDPALYGPDVRAVERLETHGAYVFLGGDRVFKMKRPVRYNYMDFSTLERRRRACERELQVNRPNAPQIYEAVLPVTRETDGGLALDGNGEPVEWVVRMRRFAQRDLLSAVTLSGRLTQDLVKRLALAVARAHERAPGPQRDDGARHCAEVCHSLVHALEELSREHRRSFVALDEVASLRDGFETALEQIEGTLDSRGRAGWIRRVHGDLHLGNIALVDGEPVLFDAIEFDEELATIDVLYDLAFLVTDLWHRGFDSETNLVLNRYLFESREPAHLDGLAALPLFLAMRLAVRAMVNAQQAVLARDPATAASAWDEARRYFTDARRMLVPVPPVLVAVGGFSGTGKSTLAAALAPSIGAPPGAVHLRSDLERKLLFGVAETERLGPVGYTHMASERTYQTMLEKAERALVVGRAVVLDAVFSMAEERAAVAALARRHHATFLGIWLEAPADILRARVGDRTGDASDATPDVVDLQVARGAGMSEWEVVSAAGTPGTTLEDARAHLARHAMLRAGGAPVAAT